MNLDNLYNISYEWAEEAYHKMLLSLSGEYKIVLSKSELEIYNFLIEFGWFNRYPVSDDNELITREIIAMLRYKQLRSKPPRPIGWDAVIKKVKEINPGLVPDEDV